MQDLRSTWVSPLASRLRQSLRESKPRYLQLLRSLTVEPTQRSLRAPPLAGSFLPYLGYALHYGLQGPELLRALQRRHGDVFSLRLLGKQITFCLSREHVEHLYEAPYEEVSFLEGLKFFAGFGTVITFNATGPEEANVGLDTLRGFLAPRVNQATAELDREVRSALARLARAHAGELELRRDLGSAISQLSVLLLAGPRLARDVPFLDAITDFDRATQSMIKTLFSSAPLRRASERRAVLDRRIQQELAARRLESSSEPHDFIDAMLVAQDPKGRPFSDEQITADLVGYIFATFANTPAAATMCLLHILRDPALEARVRAELHSVLTATGDVLDTAALKKLVLLEACLNETLRVYAPGIHLRLLRRAARVGPYLLPSDSLVAVSPYVLHRDERVYSEPDVFDPDRFLAGPRSPGKKPSALSFVPFGRGLHACIGRTLARTEVLLTVARTLTDLSPQLLSSKRAPGQASAETLPEMEWGTAGVGTPRGDVRVRVRQDAPSETGILEHTRDP